MNSDFSCRTKSVTLGESVIALTPWPADHIVFHAFASDSAKSEVFPKMMRFPLRARRRVSWRGFLGHPRLLAPRKTRFDTM